MRPRLGALFAAILILGMLAGCGGESDSTEPADESRGEAAPTGTPGSQGSSGSGEERGGSEAVKLWFTEGEQFRPVERQVEVSGEPGPLEAVKALVDGPEPGEPVETEIPAGTEVDDVEVAPGGEARVRLSPEFLEGVGARPGRRTARQRQELRASLGQIVHTVTQFAGVSSVSVRSGGIKVSGPISRKDYAEPKKKPTLRASEPGAPRSAGTRNLQRRLIRLGYLPSGSADGIFGTQTEQAVLAFQAWEGLDRDGVVGPATRAALAKAKRPKPAGEGPARRVEIHLDQGVVLLVRGGRTRRAIHASPGAPGYETPVGGFEVFRKEEMSWSVPYKVWMPYASYFNGGIALHASSSVPAYPASHGCVRVPESEALRVYTFARMGTPVLVI